MFWPKSRKQRGVLERPTWLLIVSEVLSGGHSFDRQGKCLQICSNILRYWIRGEPVGHRSRTLLLAAHLSLIVTAGTSARLGGYGGMVAGRVGAKKGVIFYRQEC